MDDLVSMVTDLTSSSSSSQQSRRLRLLEHLREDSDFLDDQRERLISIWEQMKIISFYEKRDTKTVKKVEFIPPPQEGTGELEADVYFI